ncbi:MAG: hypothetical protein ACOC54_06655 [Candidatus Sumerlaeota bacterium]
MRMISTVIVLIICAALVACGGPKVTVIDPESSTPTLQFLDTGSFDRTLAGYLKGVPEAVSITFVGDVTTNNIPDRMQSWLTKVEKYDGQVKAEPDPEISKDRSIIIGAAIAGVTLAYKYYDYETTRRMYKTSENYDVTEPLDTPRDDGIEQPGQGDQSGLPIRNGGLPRV